jgi:4-carboxymuconolactone decarboxylase
LPEPSSTELDGGGRVAIDREILIDVAASLASRRPEPLERALRLAARFAPPSAIDEVLLQSHLFVGFPLALEAFLVWRRILPDSVRDSADAVDWEVRGADVCRMVYGANYDKLRANVSSLHPQLDSLMLTAYGRVIGREGLDLVTRELCIVGLLAVWDSPRQLHSHLRGALNAGATQNEVRSTVEIACRHLDAGKAAGLRKLLDSVLESRHSGESRNP